MKKHYCDYFKVNEDFVPCMNKVQINSDPEKWLAFYPHETFVKLLEVLLQNLAGGSKTLWLSGAYGTGKSHAALVVQKLFMDNEERVTRWLEKRKAQIPEVTGQALLAQREKKVFVVFESGSDNIANPNALLARMEDSTIRALKEAKANIPTFGSVKNILDRVRQEGTFFFEARDKIQSQLGHLTCDITEFSQLEKRMQNPKLQAGLLSDIMLVLQERNIYLNLTSENLLQWMEAICQANGFSKIIFLWDEFSEYINNNRNQLTTFQALAEAAQGGKFFIVPITHTHLEAYQGSGADNAAKLGNRFDFINLEMPTNTALNLAADALEALDGDWKKDRAMLWQSIVPLITGYMASKDEDCKESPESFQGILPIHPMAAFLLKNLATTVGANQRSMFSFLSGSNGESEFRQFIQVGGPAIAGKQFLTVDYLWHYFIERDDLGLAKEVYEVRIEFANKSHGLSENEIRVFKAVLLYSLLGRLTTQSGSELVLPTVENIIQSFKGDGNIQNVDGILKELEKKHCFSIINNRCEMFHAMSESDDLVKKRTELHAKFHQVFLQEFTQKRLEKQICRFKDKLHFETRVASPDKVGVTCQAKKEFFGPSGNQVLLQFILAQNEEEQEKCYMEAEEQAKLKKDFRMLFIVLPEIHFNTFKKNNWDDYVDQWVHREMAPDATSKAIYNTQMELIEKEWHAKLFHFSQKLQILRPTQLVGGEPFVETRSWETLEQYLRAYLKETFPNFVDDLSDYNTTAMQLSGQNYQGWALAGIDSTAAKGAMVTVLKAMEKRGIQSTTDWFDKNPSHPLTALREACKSKLNNALNGSSGNCSIVKIFSDLRRPPFGLLGVGFSAFVMGFAMRDWVNNPRQQLQWTDGVDSRPLDAATLADIIGAAVKDNGDNMLRNEKKLCRMSKEEKKFIECAPDMFGIAHIPNATVENTLTNIALRLEKVSGKVPLWVLSEYIQEQEPYHFENLSTIIYDLCEAEKISKDGDVQKRREFLKDIGSRLLKTEGLSSLVAKYFSSDTLNRAFQQVVDRKKPELKELALAVGDVGNYYCQAIKEHLAETASWLWTSQNIDAELDILEAQYKVIQIIQTISGKKSFMTFATALEVLKNAMEKSNKISLQTLGDEYPQLLDFSRLLDAQKAGDGYLRLAEYILTEQILLKELFFDPASAVQLLLLKKIFAKQLAGMNAQEIASLYEQLSVGSLRSDEDFKKSALQEIEDYQKASAAKKLRDLWFQRTNTVTPQEWCISHKMPVVVLFEQLSEMQEIIPVLENSSAYQSNILEETIAKWKRAALTPADKLAEKFLHLMLPEKYREMGIAADKLSAFFLVHLDANPGNWLTNQARLHNVIEDFVREHYASTIRGEVVAKAQNMPASEAKRVLLALLENTPEAGLDFLNL